VAKPRAASSAGAGRQAKRETALVSYNDLDATLTGHIKDTSTHMTLQCHIEYDTPVSNFFHESIKAVSSIKKVVMNGSTPMKLVLLMAKN